MLSDEKYAELFPSTSYIATNTAPLFGEYAQDWLNGREIVLGTRKNYLLSLNKYWMPALARVRMDKLTPALLRKVIANTSWQSPNVKRCALQRLNAVLNTAVLDDLLPHNPLRSIETPAPSRRVIDPFTVAEADQIIEHMYSTLPQGKQIYAALFEFAFYTGMRPGEIYALQWVDVDLAKRTALVARTVADRQVMHRTKTRTERHVMLSTRALHALEKAREIADLRSTQLRRVTPHSPFVFPPSRGYAYIHNTQVTSKHFDAAVAKLGLRPRPQYNCRHTYATMCLMASMNPAFIASQLGHSVRMLLSTYARWLNSAGDWSEFSKLENSLIGTKVVQLEKAPG